MHACEVGHVYPAEVGNVRDAVLVADEVVAVGEAGVEDAVESLGFAYVALRRVRDALLCKAVEAVPGLAGIAMVSQVKSQ